MDLFAEIENLFGVSANTQKKSMESSLVSGVAYYIHSANCL